MNPLSEQQIRSSFVNTTRREASQAALPDLTQLNWDRLDYLGWRDRKAPLWSYVVLELEGEITGILLRASDPGAQRVRRKTICAWCTDVRVTDDVTLYVARRAGAPGRAGNTIGTLICTEFLCSANVRRRPTRSEAGLDDETARDQLVEQRIAGLRERSVSFVEEVLRAPKS